MHCVNVIKRLNRLAAAKAHRNPQTGKIPSKTPDGVSVLPIYASQVRKYLAKGKDPEKLNRALVAAGLDQKALSPTCVYLFKPDGWEF